MPITMPACPHCDARLTPDLDGSRLWCQFCGATRDDAEAQRLLDAYAEQQKNDPGGYEPPRRDWDMPLEDQRVLDYAWDCIQEGDHKTAAMLLNSAVAGHGDFADAWYLLSLTTEDPKRKLSYLERALAAQPYHEYAWRDKGVLEGVIPDQAPDPGAAPDVAPDGTVSAESETQACPLCGGTLTLDVALGALVCAHCGHHPGALVGAGSATYAHFRGGFDRLENALLQRRFGFSREWQIGARVLVCQNCHARLTLTPTTLAAQCPFCDSAHVLIEDAVGSFEEPDALLPFKIDQRVAARALHQRMPENQRAAVVRGEMQGVYLPFWSFKGLAMVMVSPGTMLLEPLRLGAFETGEVLVGGVTQPSQAVLYELMPYAMRDLVRYDPRYLGRWSEQVYSVDVIQASITARAYAKHVARQMASGQFVTPPEIELARTDSRAYNPPNTRLWRTVHVTTEGINYRLVLLPVWLITLILRDGSRRPAVVNGQTGEAILSASFDQPETIIAGPGRRPVQPLPIVTSPTPAPAPRSNVIRPLARPDSPPRSTVIRPLPRRG